MLWDFVQFSNWPAIANIDNTFFIGVCVVCG